ncbi:hypothetical protein ACFLU2_03075 [Chloroflexota bacterium]
MKDEMEQEGWKQASISGGMHLQRMLEMYAEVGLEVCIEEVKPGECGECTACYEADDEKIYRVYTRSKIEENK